jgi:hypothetical protein
VLVEALADAVGGFLFTAADTHGLFTLATPHLSRMCSRATHPVRSLVRDGCGVRRRR